MTEPWPESHLDVEWMTMSAPHSIGRSRYGVGTVLSTTSGTPPACASRAIRSMSTTCPSGFGSDSV